jgi:phosphopantetheine--protein transferase-like protein
MGVLRELFGDIPVVTREADPRVLGPLAEVFAEEREAVARAVSKRQNEYWATRHLARSALVELGFEPSPILNHPDRSPRWPEGIVGSISHTDGWCGVALTTAAAALQGVGIDAERIRTMSDGVIERVLTDNERRHLLQALDPAARATLHFSAKEALYKAIFPRVRRFVGFHEVEILVQEKGAFEMQVVSKELGGQLRGTSLMGRYQMQGGLCSTAVVLR